MKGEIHCKDTVVIGESARIEATIRADVVAVAGEVRGQVHASRKITLGATARMVGDLTTPAIEDLIKRATAAGATAAKVCGAGGGGCMFCYGPPSARAEITAALVAGGARVLDYTFERHGLGRGVIRISEEALEEYRAGCKVTGPPCPVTVPLKHIQLDD